MNKINQPQECQGFSWTLYKMVAKDFNALKIFFLNISIIFLCWPYSFRPGHPCGWKLGHVDIYVHILQGLHY